MATLPMLPDDAQRNELKFKLLPAIPYHIRIWTVLAFWVAGLAVQALGWLGPGAILILVGTIFALTRGYSNEPARVRRRGRRWENVNLEQFEKIAQLDRECKRWDRSAWIDITNAWGFFTALLVAGLTVFAAMALRRESEYLATACLLDAVVFFAPFWLTGIRRLYQRTEMMIRVRALQNIIARLEKPDAKGLMPTPMIELDKTDRGDLPRDVKLMVRFDDAPDDFMGIQVQVSLNNVQGTKYPYLYCVILARPGFGLKNWKVPPELKSAKILTERKQTKEVELIVVRQRTTRKSGYHTKRSAQIRVFDAAVHICRLNLSNNA